jgi:hypothetical protein
MFSGRLDVLFANAGLGELVPLGQITEAHFDKTRPAKRASFEVRSPADEPWIARREQPT